MSANNNGRGAGTSPAVNASPMKEKQPVSSVRNWDELVAEGQQLKIMEERVEAEHGNIRWQWGDLLLEVAPIGSDGAHNGSSEELQRFADELDLSFQTLRSYRQVAAAWPPDMRISGEPWTVHQMFSSRSDREELIRNPVDVRTGEKIDRWTFRAAQRFLGNKPSPHYRKPPATVQEKAEHARDLLADPEVAAATFTPEPSAEPDPAVTTAEQNARKAIARQANERARNAPPETPNAKPLQRMGRQLDASEHIARARKALGKALETIQQLDERGELDQFRDHLTRRLDAVEVVMDWTRTYLDGGETSFDDELAALLSEEA